MPTWRTQREWPALFLAGLLVAASPVCAQVAERPAAVEDTNPLVQLNLPKAKAAEFFQAWTRATTALEQGATAEARQGFAAVLRLLDELETSAAQRERVILAKASLHAHVLRDRVAGKRELARALELNPKSARALALEARFRAEDAMSTGVRTGDVSTPGQSPGVGGGKEGTP